MDDLDSNLSIDAEAEDEVFCVTVNDGESSNDRKENEDFTLACDTSTEACSSTGSVASFVDGQAVQLEDGSTAYIYRKLRGNLSNQLVQAIDLEDGTTAYIHHPNTQVSQTDLAIDEDKSVSNFRCDEDGCGKLYSSSNHLRVHKRTHTGEKPFVCQWKDCGKSFSTSYAVKSHMRVHTGEKPYDCSYAGCTKAFKTAGDLQKHTRIHTGEKPFKCPFEGCGKAFTTSNICKVHIRVHTGERPYKCPFPDCEKAFTTATNYKNHVRIHTGEKPFVCDIPECGKRFTEYSSYYKHQVVHAERNAYCCRHCNKYYTHSPTLLVHRKTLHSDYTPLESSEILLGDRKKLSKKTKDLVKEIPSLQYSMSDIQMRALGKNQVARKETPHEQQSRMVLLPVAAIGNQSGHSSQASNTTQVAAVMASGSGQQLAIISHDGSTQQFTLALTDQGSTVLLPASEAPTNTESQTKSDNQVLYITDSEPQNMMSITEKDNTQQRIEASETHSSVAETTPINTDIWLHQPQKDDIATVPEVKDSALKNLKDEENISIQFDGSQIPCDDPTSSDSNAYLEIGGVKYQLKIVANESDAVDQICVEDNSPNRDILNPIQNKEQTIPARTELNVMNESGVSIAVFPGNNELIESNGKERQIDRKRNVKIEELNLIPSNNEVAAEEEICSGQLQIDMSRSDVTSPTTNIEILTFEEEISTSLQNDKESLPPAKRKKI